ncbi:MAG: hypothetical protein AAGD12_03155 [Pseudomonadota bacterium]
MKAPVQPGGTTRRRFCLTELSVLVLVAAALAMSAILWIAILAVL